MCGRYAASRHADQLVEIFEADEVVAPVAPVSGHRAWTEPSWNIAPTDEVAAVVQRVSRDDSDQSTRSLVGLRWGLVPSWARDRTGASGLINARLETVAEKPSFRRAFAARRCLIPADGYYEWYTPTARGAGPRQPKQPFYIHPVEGSLMVMAGIHEFWRDPSRPEDAPLAWVRTCAIITTAATDDLGVIHERMPVQVGPQNWEAWLDPALNDSRMALDLVHVPEPGEMGAHAVSRLVGNVANDGPQLVAPLPLEQGHEDAVLFG